MISLRWLQEFADLPSDPDGVPYSIFFAIHEDAARRERAGE